MILGTPTNHSVVKAFALLRSFNEADEWLTSAELSRRANLPGASGYRLVQTLEKVGAVVRGDRGRYRPSMRLVAVSPRETSSPRLRTAATDILEALANQLNITVHMGVLDEDMVTYVTKHTGASAFAVHTEVGAQQEAYCSGLGKILLAALAAEPLDAYLREGELVALTPNTITDPDAFRAELKRVQAQGFAVDNCEISPEMRCLAVPVRDGSGRVIAAVSVTDEAARLDEDLQRKALRELSIAVAAISRRLYS